MSKNAWKVSRQVLRDVRTTQVVVMYARRSARKIAVVSSLITVVLKFPSLSHQAQPLFNIILVSVCLSIETLS